MKALIMIALTFLTSAALAAPRPAVRLNDPVIHGKFQPLIKGQDCTDEGRNYCSLAEIGYADGRIVVSLGYDEETFELKQSGDVLTFSHTFGNENCDNPGCGDPQSIYGIVYYKQIKGKWVLTIKVTTVVEFGHPEEETSPSGIVTSTGYLIKSKN